MKKDSCVLPKNKGVPLIYWRNKRPLYVVSGSGHWEKDYWDVSYRALLYLLKACKGKILFIYKHFPPIDESNLDKCLQLVYENLMIFHGLLAPVGSLYLSSDWVTQGYLHVLADEIFGEEDTRVKYIEEGRF